MSSNDDQARADALASDPAFASVDEVYESLTDIRVRPGTEAPGTGLTRVDQTFANATGVEGDRVLAELATILAAAGWVDLVANCDNASISGQREDDIGPVSIVASLRTDLDSGPTIHLEILAALVDDSPVALQLRGEDLGCLTEL